MARKIVFFSVFLAVTVISANASGEFSILHSPDSLHFSGSSKVPESQLKEIYSATLGLSVEENCDWNGLSIVDPFNTPEAIVQIYIDGVPRIGDSVHWKSKDYPLVVDEYEPDMFESMEHRIGQRVSSGSNKLVNIKLSDTKELNSYSDVFGKIGHIKPAKQTFKHLKYTNDVDHQFLTELEALKTITSKVESGAIVPDNVLDFYNFRVTSLHPLSDFHGANSLETKEAKKLLARAIEELSDAFKKAYDSSVLIATVFTDMAHTRRVVRAVDTPTGTRQEIDDGAYSPDYAAIFNIILWFSVVFAFTLIAIVYAIMDMDPGRDSIIYRMTSTRMKKDN